MKVCWAMVALTIGSGVASADQVQLFSPRDTTLYQDDTGAVANSLGFHFFVGKTAVGLTRRGMLAFDFGAIPAGSTINSVSLRLSVDKVRSSSGVAMTMHRVIKAWGEGPSNSGSAADGGGTTAQPGDATWLHSVYNTTLWTTPGGDYVSAASASTSVGGIADYTWSGAGLVADVQGWLNDPTSNNGWLLKIDATTSGTAKRIVSGDSNNTFQVPVLTVNYTVPSPGGMGLALMGVAFAGRRRRRAGG